MEDSGLNRADEERVKAVEAELRRIAARLDALYRFLGLRS